MENLNNKKYLKQKRRDLRNNLTSAEASLWKLLKNKQIDGYRFRRQFSIDNFIVDFYCPKKKVAIELDGAHHYTTAGLESDIKRDHHLNSLGVKVLRFENREVFEATDALINTIKQTLNNPL